MKRQAAPPDQRLWDRLGAGLSLLCLLHCLGAPLALAVLPVWGSQFLFDGAVHQALVVVVLVAALAALVPGYCHHRRWAIPLLGVVGLAALAAGAFGPESCRPGAGCLVVPMPLDATTAWRLMADSTLTIGGGLALLVAHAANCRCCR
jgi:hypothetical protein